jgi:hypothetical protein
VTLDFENHTERVCRIGIVVDHQNAPQYEMAVERYTILRNFGDVA